MFSHEDWYLNNGSSRHMTGEKNYLKLLKPCSNRNVTFCDGDKIKILGKGKMDYPGIPSLDDVLLVECFTKIIISISQLCNQELCVNYNCSECIVTNKHI